MSQSLSVAVLFGGQSAEHEVSIQSARNVRKALAAAGYEVVLVAIDRQGVWRLADDIAAPDAAWPLTVLLPGGGGQLMVLDGGQKTLEVDVVFPVLHGPNGEDGSLQG